MSQPAVLVISCDKYADMWNPFFQLFWKRWPDCPYPVFLGTNYKTFEFNGVTSIPVGEDRTWAQNLHLMLDVIDSPRIIMFLEDFLMTRDVNTDAIRNMVKVAEQYDLGCLRLHPLPPPTRQLREFPGIGVIQRGDDWRVSTQTAIWDVKLLRSLAWPGLTAWEFETIGSLVSDTMQHTFWSVYEPVIDYRNGVVLGQWVPEGLEVCREAGVEVDLSSRASVSHAELLAQSPQSPWSLSQFLGAILPNSMRRTIIRWLRLSRREFYLGQMLKEAGLQRPDSLK
ncbi:MAG: hypothetical protein HY912_18455 [Desulfomonile tiedjei]|uniref:Uncharacterized protein n=1 Tax=Desulfomonile tiedjei TaxID=2358 RepID=A0A9D6Z504_9BACT|nr:hypothetical protein [Desulfomonile tiedjei]